MRNRQGKISRRADHEDLRAHARNVRRMIIETATPVRASHTGGALSAVDVMVALYFNILKLDPKNPHDPHRDILVYSKGHSSLGLYATLVERGFAPPEVLKKYYVDGGTLAGHPVRGSMPGVEVCSGSLGHGLPLSYGIALARKRLGNPGRVFCILSDGECDEGSTWEAALGAGHHQLDNLVAVIDYNRIQSFGSTAAVLDLDPLAEKWQAFRWNTRVVDGHSFPALLGGFTPLPFTPGRPSLLVANTVKGKGVRQMENQLAWHYKSLDDPRDYEQALADIAAS